MSSVALVVASSCPCGADGERSEWVVLDAADRPDLIEALVAGRFQARWCPACGENTLRTTSMLVASGLRSPLLFAADPTAPGPRIQRQLDVALSMYAGRTGVDPDRVAFVPHRLLPTAAARHVCDDVAAWQARTWFDPSPYGEWIADVAASGAALTPA